MILGRGTATTETAIITEYRAFLASSSGIVTDRVRERVGLAAGTVCKRLGKPIGEWTEQDMLALFAGRCKMVVYGYAAFLSFLIFRGYVQVRQLAFYDAFPLGLCRLHRPALQPLRERLEATRQEVGYAAESAGSVGTVLNLLIALLAFVGKELPELTRADFDTFRTTYDQWYQETRRRVSVCTLYCTRACSQRVPEFAAKVYHPSVASVSRVLFPQHSFSWGERYVRQEQRSYGRSRTATSPSHHLKRPCCRSNACYPSSDRPALPRLGF